MPANITIRLEMPSDYREVEEITRDAFWDENVPGCDEHYLAHALRTESAFVPELDLVAEQDGEIVGNIMYATAEVIARDGSHHQVLTFGPLTVKPERQGEGIGSLLVKHSLKRAGEMGFRAVLIYGDPGYYKRFGFLPARDFGIHTPYNTYSPALQVFELLPGSLTGISGAFEEGEAYHLDPDEAAAFDLFFSSREKGFKESQLRFQEILAASVPVETCK
ncbi:MAG TPA: N-acetyltransferase [Candidatus Cloacimonadota bacterium]|nr:N-acetyltransferase [Candidatus Cloacimonadota bacterium]